MVKEQIYVEDKLTLTLNGKLVLCIHGVD